MHDINNEYINIYNVIIIFKKSKEEEKKKEIMNINKN